MPNQPLSAPRPLQRDPLGRSRRHCPTRRASTCGYGVTNPSHYATPRDYMIGHKWRDGPLEKGVPRHIQITQEWIREFRADCEGLTQNEVARLVEVRTQTIQELYDGTIGLDLATNISIEEGIRRRQRLWQPPVGPPTRRIRPVGPTSAVGTCSLPTRSAGRVREPRRSSGANQVIIRLSRSHLQCYLPLTFYYH